MINDGGAHSSQVAPTNSQSWELEKAELEHELAAAKMQAAEASAARDEALRRLAVVEGHVASSTASRSAAYVEGLREGYRLRPRLQALAPGGPRPDRPRWKRLHLPR